MRQGYVNLAAFYCVFQSVTLGFLIKSSRSLTWCLSRFWHFHISFKALRGIEEENKGLPSEHFSPHSDKLGVI